MPAFTPGNIVVYRIGDGIAALSSAAAAVFLDEYTTTGAYVQTVIMPTTDAVGGANNQMFTASGTSTAEGLLNRSVDGRYLLATGYDAPTGTPTINMTTGAAFARVVARVAADGTFDTSTRLADFASGSSPRSAISIDGGDIWITGGAGGVRYTTVGATSSLQLATTPTNFRGIDMYDGQLYVSAQTGAFRFATVGSGHPTTAGQTVTNVPGTPATTLGSPYGFFMADLDGIAGVDTLYVCDDGIGLLKYSLVSGSWVSSGTIGTNADDYFGVTGSVSGSTVTLYATRLNGGGADTIVRVIDTSGFGGTLTATATTLVTAAANTAFRGLDFSPQAAAAATITIQAAPVAHDEGDAGSTAFVFTISRSSGTGTATVDYAVTGMGGLDANDFVGAALPAGTATFSGTDLTTTITINVNGDLTAEATENFTVTLSNASAGYTLGAPSTQTGTITDDDSHGSISVDSPSAAEGDTGTTPGSFTLTRSGGSVGTVTVDYVITLPGGAGGADGTDVSATLTGTVTFLNGETIATIPYTVSGDRTVEPNETFTIALSNATGGAIIGTGNGTATITNDDVAGTVTVGDVSILEGDSGQSFVTITLTRTGGSGDFSVDYDSDDDSATVGDDDYEGVSGTAVFTGGATSVTFQVAINGDTASEGDESFNILLSGATNGAIIGDDTGVVTITDDEGAGSVSIGDASVTESDSGTVSLTFTLTRSGGSAPFAVTVTTSDDSATEPGDYAANSETISFGANENVKTFTVTVNGDTDFEADETLSRHPLRADRRRRDRRRHRHRHDRQRRSSIRQRQHCRRVDHRGRIRHLHPPADRYAERRHGGLFGRLRHVERRQPQQRLGHRRQRLCRPKRHARFRGRPEHRHDRHRRQRRRCRRAQRGAHHHPVERDQRRDPRRRDRDRHDHQRRHRPRRALRACGSTSSTTTMSAPTPASSSRSPRVAGTNLSGYSIVLYNGNGGVSYRYRSTLERHHPQPGRRLRHRLHPRCGEACRTGARRHRAGRSRQRRDRVHQLRRPDDRRQRPGHGPDQHRRRRVRAGHAPAAPRSAALGGPGSPLVVFSDDTPGQLNAGQLLGPTPTVAVSDVSVNEAAGTMTFTVTRSNVAPGAFTVDYATANGTATAGSDYGATSGTLSFTDNQLQATVTVTISDDGAAEFDETLFLNLSNRDRRRGHQRQPGRGHDRQRRRHADHGLDRRRHPGRGDIGHHDLHLQRRPQRRHRRFRHQFRNRQRRRRPSPAAITSPIAASSISASARSIKTISVTVNGDMTPEPVENFFVNLSNATNNVIVTDASGTGAILDGAGTLNFIHDIQGTAYFSPLLAAESISSFNVATAAYVTVQAVVTAIDNDGDRQGFYIQEQVTDWDGNSFTSEGIFVMTRNDARRRHHGVGRRGRRPRHRHPRK